MAEFSTFVSIIGNGRSYNVPAFQRDYTWSEEEWDDLWADIENLHEEGRHYMGYIVLQVMPTSSKQYMIIDGQQRITTLSMIYLAGIKLLENWADQGIDSDNNNERKRKLTERFISNTPASSLLPSSKLRLNKNNDNFYQSFILRFRTPTNIRSLKPSEKRLYNGLQFFYEKLKIKFNPEKSGANLAIFLEDELAEKLTFTIIEVSDDLNAYKVFETLNARGVKLSTSDLLKNFLFSIADSDDSTTIIEAERQWQDINDQLSENDLTSFLRHYWNSRNNLERKQTLFKAIKNKTKKAVDVLNLLENLQDLAPVYTALSNAGDSLWDGFPEASESISILNLLRVTQCYPLLLSSYKKLPNAEFVKILKGLVTISFRYLTISSLNPNELEGKYNKASIEVFKGNLSNANQVFNELKSIYVSDENFRSNFSTKILDTNSARNKKLIRYILFSVENQIAEKKYQFEDSTATIEHIFPENPNESWDENFQPNDRDKFQYLFSLGNYTLLEDSINRTIGNESFEVKKKAYERSQYVLSNKKINYEEWSPKTIKNRQVDLAKVATTVWKINF